MSRSILISLAILAGCAGGPAGSDTADDTPIESACGEDLDVFIAEVWEPVLDRRCTTCHTQGSGTAAAESSFVLVPDDPAASMRAAIQVADRILQKPTGAHADGHGGGTVVAPDSKEAAALRFWQAFVLDGDCDPPEPWTCVDGPAPRQLCRLTHAEYDRTVQALLHTDLAPGEGFAADNVVDGFDNDARALVVDDLLASQYADAAETLAFGVDVDPLLPCDPRVAGRSACAVLFIEDFGFRAFRRPLSQDDVDRYAALWEAVAVDDGFTTGVRWVIAAMLQSPHFLYRSELGVKQGGAFQLTDWELASALSYDLWGAPPDDALLDAAADGLLSTPDGLAAQVARMREDPRTTEITADFVEAWLHLGALETVSREGLDPALRESLRWETRQLVSDVAGQDGTLSDLVLAEHTFADDVLAEHYGFDAPGRIDLSGTPYGGLFTQGSVLTAHGRHTGSSPVQRGVVVRERMLCEPLPPPPANVDASPPEIDPNSSTRELYTEHARNPKCAECHDLIDPIGFGFEHYDQLGRYREMDGVHRINDSGDVDGAPFAGPDGLAAILLDDPRFRSCFVQTWRRHATGAPACADDPGEIGLADPLFDLPSRQGFATRLDEDGAGDSLAVGERVAPELPDDDITPSETLSIAARTDDWGTGYCSYVTVLNEGDAAQVWSVPVLADGTVENHWNSVYAEEGEHWVFSGTGWNASLEPGASLEFGFCAAR